MKAKLCPNAKPVQIIISGDINSVKNFLSIRRGAADEAQKIEDKTAIVIADKDALTITLSLQPNNPLGAVITAALQISPELEQFNINRPVTYNREQFIKLIRFNKIWFDNSGNHEKLLNQLLSFSASAKTNLEQQSDNRANKNSAFKKDVSTDVLPGFILNIPIFKNQQKSRFYVEIAFDITETQIKFWLESVELNEAIIKQRDEIFLDQLTACEGLVIINK